MELAAQLSDRWYEACQERGLPTDSYHALRQGLRGFLPPDVLAGIGYRDDRPLVLALGADALLVFEPPEGDRLLNAVALFTSSIRELGVECELASTNHADYRVCTWTLHDVVGDARTYSTRRVIGNGFDSDNGGEGVMLALAEHLGWATPLHLENPARHSEAA